MLFTLNHLTPQLACDTSCIAHANTFSLLISYLSGCGASFSSFGLCIGNLRLKEASGGRRCAQQSATAMAQQIPGESSNGTSSGLASSRSQPPPRGPAIGSIATGGGRHSATNLRTGADERGTQASGIEGPTDTAAGGTLQRQWGPVEGERQLNRFNSACVSGVERGGWTGPAVRPLRHCSTQPQSTASRLNTLQHSGRALRTWSHHALPSPLILK